LAYGSPTFERRRRGVVAFKKIADRRGDQSDPRDAVSPD